MCTMMNGADGFAEWRFAACSWVKRRLEKRNNSLLAFSLNLPQIHVRSFSILSVRNCVHAYGTTQNETVEQWIFLSNTIK